MSASKEFLSVRIDAELKDELHKAAQVEHRSLSGFARLLLEYAWDQYLKAGTMRDLLSPQEHSTTRRE